MGRIHLRRLLFCSSFSLAIVVSAQQITLKPGAIPGKEFHRTNARDFAYCEIARVFGTPPNVMAQFYTSSGPGDRCPVNEMAAINPTKLAAELGAEFVYINPTPQTAGRHWVMDELWFFKVSESVDVHGVQATWAASMSPELMKRVLEATLCLEKSIVIASTCTREEAWFSCCAYRTERRG